MNEKDLKKWQSDFGLTNEQFECIKGACSETIKMRKTGSNKLPSAATAIEKFRRLEIELHQITERDYIDLATFASFGNERSEQKLYSSYDFLRSAIPHLKELCKEAVENYNASDIKNGGRPERVPGRRYLAIQVAMIMKSAGIMPTKTPDTGAFARLLEIVLKSAGLDPDNIPTKNVLYPAVDFVKDTKY